MQATPHVVGAAACWVALALILAVSPYVSVTYECVPPAGKGEFPPPCAVETDEASTTVVLTTTWQATREYVKLVTPEETKACPRGRAWRMGSAQEGWHCCESAQGAHWGDKTADLGKCKGARCCLSPGSMFGCTLSKERCYPEEALGFSLSARNSVGGPGHVLELVSKASVLASDDHATHQHVLLHRSLGGHAQYVIEMQEPQPARTFVLHSVGAGWSTLHCVLCAAGAALVAAVLARFGKAVAAAPPHARSAESEWVVVLLLLAVVGLNEPFRVLFTLVGGSAFFELLAVTARVAYYWATLLFLLLAATAVTDAGAFRAWKGRAAALAPLLIGHVETIAYGLGLTSRAQHKATGFIRDICTLIGFVVLVIQLTRAAFRTSDAPPAARRVVVGALGAIGVVGALLVTESAVHGAAVRQLELVITLALNQLTVAAALVYWPKPVGKRGYDDDDGFSATAAMMQKYGSV